MEEVLMSMQFYKSSSNSYDAYFGGTKIGTIIDNCCSTSITILGGGYKQIVLENAQAQGGYISKDNQEINLNIFAFFRRCYESESLKLFLLRSRIVISKDDFYNKDILIKQYE